MMLRVVSFGAALAFSAFISQASAQDFGGAFSGFATNSDQPIQIEADQLEVRDAEKVAVYKGHVRVLQGGTLLEAPEIRIFYSGGATGQKIAGSEVTRIEAGTGVMVKSEDRTATGNRIVFDMAKELITLDGNVVVTQGGNVVRGQRLVVNLATKQGRIEGGRVQTLIAPGGKLRTP